MSSFTTRNTLLVSCLLLFGGLSGVHASSTEQTNTIGPKSTWICPPEMTLVGYGVAGVFVCVDRWEASLVDLNGNVESPFVNPGERWVSAVSQPGVKPQAHISLDQSRTACFHAGKRLCRAEEWRAACRGPGNHKYPYGDVRVPGVCVDDHKAALATFYDEGSRYGKAMNDSRLNQQPETLELTGNASKCTNAYGVYDMVGNLHEWADDGAFHGGYYQDVIINREGCDYTTTAHGQSYFDYSTGFRCCTDPSISVDPGDPLPSASMSATAGRWFGPAVEALRLADDAGKTRTRPIATVRATDSRRR